MSYLELKDLLKHREVLEEIDRHKWFQSERSGHDVGFEAAAEDWFKNFAAAWVSFNLPDHAKKLPPELRSQKDETPANPIAAKQKRRKAKTYLPK